MKSPDYGTLETIGRPVRDWATAVHFYEQLVDELGLGQQPMLDLVQRIATREDMRSLHPSTSHDSLSLATAPSYEAQYRTPTVFIEYSERDCNFSIKYMRPNGGGAAETEFTKSPDSREVVDRMLHWLRTGELSKVDQP